jgi:hypothetical protein
MAADVRVVPEFGDDLRGLAHQGGSVLTAPWKLRHALCGSAVFLRALPMVIDLWPTGILPLGFIAGNLLAVMGSYFVKRKNLSLLERQLRESVRRGAPRNLLLRLAEEVRIARIRASKATKARIPPQEGRKLSGEAAALRAKIASLQTLTPEAILDEYSS